MNGFSDCGLTIASPSENLCMAKRLLIIDDDPAILDVLNIVFLDEGYNVVISDNSEIIVDLQKIAPDLILLDVNITTSIKNGDIICGEIKAVAETHLLPIILLSAELDLVQISIDCGADGYIKKPFDLDDLTGKVRDMLAGNH